MQVSCKSIDDDDDAAKLMPLVAKLIREDSGSLESNGSTSMSLCGTSGKDKIEPQIAKPNRQRRAEAVLRDVANKFLRKGAIGKRSIGACTPSAFDTLGSFYRRNAYVFEKENLRPKASTLVKQGAPPVRQQKSTMRDTSQKAVREFRKKTTRSVVKLGQRRAVKPKVQRADKSNTHMVPEHLATHAATVALPTASHNSQGSEGSCYVSNKAAKSRRGKVKLYMKSTPLSLSELQEKFAELDGEALEEEEVSIAHLMTSRPFLASETVLQHADDIRQNVVDNRKDLSRNVNGRKDEVGAALNPNIEEATIPNHAHEQGQEGNGICISQSKFMRKTPGRDQDVQLSEPTCKENARGNVPARTGTNFGAITRRERQLSPSGCRYSDDSRVTMSKAFLSSQRSKQFSSKLAAQQRFNVKLHRKGTELIEQQSMRVDEVDIEQKEGLTVYPTLTNRILLSGVVSQHADGDERDNAKCRDGGNQPRFEEGPGSSSVNGIEDKARTADTKTSAIPLDASAQEFSGKGTSVCAVFELEHAEGSCNDKRGYSPLKPNEENFKESTADGPDGDASNREDTVLGHTSKFREDVQSAPSKAKRLSKQEGVSDVPMQEGTHSTRGISATPPRNPLKLTCHHYSRIGRSTDMSQRRLVFDSSSESLLRPKVVERNSDDVSVSSVEFKGSIHPAIDVLNPDVHEYDVNMTSIPHQEAKLPFTYHDEVIGHVDDRGCTSQSSKSKAAAHCEGVIERDTPSTADSHEQNHNNLPALDVTSNHVADGFVMTLETPLTGSLAQDDNLPAFEASKGVVGTDPGIDSPGPQTGLTTKVPKARGLGKRTWANLGDPIVVG